MNSGTPSQQEKRASILHPPSFILYPLSSILLSFAALLAVSWQRWTSVIADSGRELDLPLRLLQGEALYRDVHYLYPPLAPYLNALLYRLFGARLEVLQASGILCALLLAWLCYRIARHLLPERESALATIAIIVWCVFKPAGNLISPYAYAALYALIFSLGALLCALRCVRSRNFVSLYPAGLFIALATLAKFEFALAALLAVGLAILLVARTEWRASLMALGFPALPFTLIVAPCAYLLSRRYGWQVLIEDCHLFLTNLPGSLRFYNAQRMGLDHPLSSLWQMFGAASLGLAGTGGIVWLATQGQAQLRRRAAYLCLLGLALVLLVGLTTAGRWDGSPLRALPVWLLATILFEWRRKARSAEQATLLLIAVYSLAMLARVALRVPSGGAFGSFFLPTSLILLCYFLARGLPQAVEGWTQQTAAARRTCRLGLWLFALAILVTAVVYSVRYRHNYSFAINTPRGRLFTTQAIGPAYRDALAFLQTQTEPGEAVAIFPEGSDLAFLTGRRMPLRHQIFIPGLMSAADEERAIRQLRETPIRYVLIVNRPMREFGAEAFGRDFYTRLGAAIEAQYQLVKVCGAVTEPNPDIGAPQFFIKILRRKD